jgi:hypothetical protein
MNDAKKARRLFREEGLAFPMIPEVLAARLKERGKWLFSTREIGISPYNLHPYLNEVKEGCVEAYALLAHSGHGVNSWAIQYYLVHGRLRMFLHLGWGGAYIDPGTAAATIRDCFSLADKIIPAAMMSWRLRAGDTLTVVGSDVYGSYWSAPGQSGQKVRSRSREPAAVLADALRWLLGDARGGNMASDLPVVTMNIARKWFAAILAQPPRKKVEYRSMSPYWERRLASVGDGPFKLRLLNGMLPPVPEALILVNRLERDEANKEFRLRLGCVLSVKNWDRDRERPIGGKGS